MTDSGETTDSTEYSTTESEGNSSPSHFLPAAIITAVFIALILVIIAALKLCNYVRQRASTKGLSRIFRKTDSEQSLQGRSRKEIPVYTDKQLEEDVPASGSHGSMQIDLEQDTSTQQLYDDDVRGFIERARMVQSAGSESSAGSCDEHEGACSDDYIVYNLDHDGRNNIMTVEVEMHPKELQCYSAKKLALSTV